jgi:hypothetical protein
MKQSKKKSSLSVLISKKQQGLKKNTAAEDMEENAVCAK